MDNETPLATGGPGGAPQAPQNTQDLLLEIFGGGGDATAASPPPQQKSKVEDIMSLFGNGASASPAPAPGPGQSASALLAGLGSLGSSPPAPSFIPSASPPPPAAAAPASTGTAYPAYDKNGLVITLTPQTSKAHPGLVAVVAKFIVSGGLPASNLTFQAAVPKVWLLTGRLSDLLTSLLQSQQLQLQPISNSTVAPGAVETQQLRIKAPVGVSDTFDLISLTDRLSRAPCGCGYGLHIQSVVKMYRTK
jgi:AP-1 complex subunit gamma-1